MGRLHALGALLNFNGESLEKLEIGSLDRELSPISMA